MYLVYWIGLIIGFISGLGVGLAYKDYKALHALKEKLKSK